MAVEDRHLNLILPQSFSSRDFAADNVQNYASNNPPTAYGTTAATASNQRYGFQSTNVKSESGVTYAASNSRKRQRDDCTIRLRDYRGSSLLGDDLAFQIHQQQLHVDRIVSQHTERLRIGIEQRRRRYATQMAEALAQHIKKQLKSKEDELVNVGKINAALEERVKSLALENQMWRDLAQTNEATANALRKNLEQALSERQHHRRLPAEDDDGDDARSFCGSNYEAENRPATTMCRRCEGGEASVLVLPCRHLCLCTLCGSSTHSCPICHSIKTNTLHVNLLP